MPEIVYAFTNVAMPGLIKIGRSSRDRLEKRLADLSNPSGIPVPFECLYAAEVDDGRRAEEALHNAFDRFRLNKNREFFKTEPSEVLALLKLLDKSNGRVTAAIQGKLEALITPEGKETINEINEEEDSPRRRWFTFSAIDIPVGAELVYTADSAKVCKVVDDRHVEYEGNHYRISNLAALFRREKGCVAVVNGTLFFTYNGETLNDRRNRLEAEE